MKKQRNIQIFQISSLNNLSFPISHFFGILVHYIHMFLYKISKWVLLCQTMQISRTLKTLNSKKYLGRYLFCLVYQIKIENRLYGVKSFSLFVTIWHLIWKIISYTSDEIISKGVNIIWVLHAVMSKSLLFKKNIFVVFAKKIFLSSKESRNLCLVFYSLMK